MNAASAQGEAKREPLSVLLAQISADSEDGVLTIGEIADVFGSRAFGALMFLFAIPNVLPLPPGSSTLLGMPLFLLAPQVAIGGRSPWLPRFLREKAIRSRDLYHVFSRIIPRVEAVEKVSKPRLTFLFGPIGDRVIGVICSLLAFVLILPIPLGNLVPALCIGTLAFALTQRDGIIALIGHAMAAVSAALLVVSASVVNAGIQKLIAMFGG